MLANEKNVASLQNGFDAKLRELINQMNQNFAKVSSSGPSAPAVLRLLRPYKWFVHKVEKERPWYRPKVQIQDQMDHHLIRLLTPPRYLLGRNCLSPRNND